MVQFPLGNRNYFHHCHTCVFQEKVCLVTYSFNPPWRKGASETFASFSLWTSFLRVCAWPTCEQNTQASRLKARNTSNHEWPSQLLWGFTYSIKLLPVTEDAYIFLGLFWQAKSFYFPYCCFFHGIYTGHSLCRDYWIFKTPKAPGFKYSYTYTVM